METSLRRYAPIAVVVGLLGLVAAAAVYLLQRQFNVTVQASLAIGLLGLAVAILLDPATVQNWAGRRQARYGGNVLLMVLALVGILILANYIVSKNVKQWDLTANKVNTLAPETLQALQTLQSPVKAISFYTSSFASAKTTAKNLFEQYRVASGGKFTYEFHDPQGEPALTRQYNISSDGTTVLVMDTHQESITFASEDQIDGALVRLAHPTKRKVYFVTGDGEHGIDATDQTGMATVVGLLKNQNYDVQTLNLTVTNTVPSDAKALVVAGPQVPLSSIAADLIQVYLEQGGALVYLQDPLIQLQSQVPLSASEPLVDALAQNWGVRLNRDLILDLNNGYQGHPDFPLSGSYGSSSIVSRLQSVQTVYPEARSVTIPAAGHEVTSTTYSALVNLSPGAWGETNLEELSRAQGPALDGSDTQPPLTLAVTAQNSTTKARLVVIGDSDFATNAASALGANANLLVNSIDWATADETLINVTPRTPTQLTLSLTSTLTINAIFVVVVILMPLIVLVMGGVVWFQRRRHV
jgi:ABC-type uncharacterized transport system involved in gliding motility auxiliary subunit